MAHSGEKGPPARCSFVGEKSNGYDDRCGLAEGHDGMHMAAVYTLLTDLDPRCKGTLGSRPEWMGVDQYDPCRCRLDRGHDGPHWCEHLGSPDPRAAQSGSRCTHPDHLDALYSAVACPGCQGADIARRPTQAEVDAISGSAYTHRPADSGRKEHHDK